MHFTGDEKLKMTPACQQHKPCSCDVAVHVRKTRSSFSGNSESTQLLSDARDAFHTK